MFVFRVNGTQIYNMKKVEKDYVPKENEVLVSELPKIEIVGDQRAYLYFINNKVEYIIKEKGEY